MAEDVRRLPEVFGVSREIPLTLRDARLRRRQAGQQASHREKHLVVYGRLPSKGRLALGSTLHPEDYIVVQCANATTISQLYASILKEAGATVEVSEKETTRGEKKVSR